MESLGLCMNMHYCFTSTCHKYIYINVCVKCGHFEVSIFFLWVDVVHKVLFICETTQAKWHIHHVHFTDATSSTQLFLSWINSSARYTFCLILSGGLGGRVVSSKCIFRPTLKPATVLIILPCVILWLKNLWGRVQI